MQRFGNIAEDISDPHNRINLDVKLTRIGQRFYIIDIDSYQPHTVAVFTGHFRDFSYPYLLMQTGFKYLRFAKDNRYSDSIDFTKSECIVVDLSQLTISARIPVPEDTDDPLSYRSYWVDHHTRLTEDGKLLVVRQDLLEPEEISESVKVYLIEKKEYMHAIDYYLMERLLFQKELKILESMHINKPCLLSDLFFKRAIPFRAYGVGLSSQKVDVIELISGETTSHELILPGGSVWNTFDGFLTPDNEICYLWTPRKAMSYFYPMGRLPRNYTYVPAVSDLIDPPHELSYFKSLKLCEPSWKLSPQRHWLILYSECKDFRFSDVILCPAQALYDSTVLEKSPTFCRIPQVYWESKLQFIANERYVYIREKRGKESDIIYRCEGGNPIRISAPGENAISSVCFSPDGRYIAYTCEIEGKEGFWLQVREVPR